MDAHLQTSFLKRWKKYFTGAGLPIVFFYSDEDRYGAFLKPMSRRSGSATHCLVALLKIARDGNTVAFSKETMGCPGGARYSGYSTGFRPNFKYFLSCGIPGELEGERYKKTPEIVEESVKNLPQIIAPAKYLVFKRWDAVEPGEEPVAVVFFAPPDVLAGLFTLANFREAGSMSVIAPFSSGCGSIIGYPFIEHENPKPRAVLGLFDPSARPYVGTEVLTFAAPMTKFRAMVEDMDESFLITPTWEKILRRIKASPKTR